MTSDLEYLKELRDADTATMEAIQTELSAAQTVANTIPALSDQYQIVMFRRDGYDAAIHAIESRPEIEEPLPEEPATPGETPEPVDQPPA